MTTHNEPAQPSWARVAAQVALWPLFVGLAGIAVWSLVYLCTPIRNQGDGFGHGAAGTGLVLFWLPVMAVAGAVLFFVSRGLLVRWTILLTMVGLGLSTLVVLCWYPR